MIEAFWQVMLDNWLTIVVAYSLAGLIDIAYWWHTSG